MKVYVFGNDNIERDCSALEAAKVVADAGWDEGVEFVFIKLNEDLPFDNRQDAIIMDVVQGLTEVTLIQDAELDRIVLPPRTTAHDFDLGFQLKYLKKLGKLGRVKIIGLPMAGNIDYDRIHSILRKLVAQDMQGS
ncbi:MAG: hypothetical protein WC988_03340 [Patescibacteria group bacterium]